MAAIASVNMMIRAARPAAAKSARFAGARAPLRAVRRSAPVKMATRTMAAFTSDSKGDFPSIEYRIFFKDGEKVISPWHDVSLYNDDGTLNAIIEIPKETMAKVRIDGARSLVMLTKPY